MQPTAAQIESAIKAVLLDRVYNKGAKVITATSVILHLNRTLKTQVEPMFVFRAMQSSPLLKAGSGVNTFAPNN